MVTHITRRASRDNVTIADDLSLVFHHLFLFYAPPRGKVNSMQILKLTGVMSQTPLFVHPVFTFISHTSAPAANTTVQHNAEL